MPPTEEAARVETATPPSTRPRPRVPPSEMIKLGSLRLVRSAENCFTIEEILKHPSSSPRYRRILFIAPRPHGYDVPPAPTPSFGYLGEILTRHGFEWNLLDLRLGGGIEDVRRTIESFRPDVIGFTFQFTIGASHCVDFLRKIQAVTDLPVIIGGAHLTLRGHNILEDCRGVSLAVQKEGEYPLLAILKGMEIERIPNLWIPRGEAVIENAPLSYVDELDALPWPRFPGSDMKRFARVGQVDVLTSRGCPFLCTFCSVALTQGRRFRTRSPEDVVDELRHWYRRGIRIFNFIDDILTVNKRRFHTILDLILKEKLEGVTFSCIQGMRADACDMDLLEKMRAAGFEFLGFGVESGSDRILQVIKKGETVAEIDEAITNACKVGFEVGLFFIIGSPTENAEDVEKSFALAMKHPVMYAKFHICLPYPGTELARWVDENSNWYVRPDVYLQKFSYHDDVIVFDNKGMGYKEHQESIRRAMAVDVEVRRRYALRRMVSSGIPRTVAVPASHLFYNVVTFRRVRKLAKTALGARIKNGVARLFNLQSKAHTGSAEIAFTDGM